MDSERALEELTRAATRLGVQVRQRVLRVGHGAGGLCRIRGAPVVLLSARAPIFERASLVARSLVELGTLDPATLSPECREFVERQSPRVATAAARSAAGPGLSSLDSRGRRRSP